MGIISTIAAISTAQGAGGIGVIRISGQEAFSIADKIFHGVSHIPLSEKKGYTAEYGEIHSLDTGEKLDDVVALLFRAPKSYTGENVVEFSCHGGLTITRRILREVFSAGAAPAQPGEFTKRAFLNGKMDLTQAEAVMQIISAGGEQAARAAESGAGGALSQKISSLRQTLEDQAAHLTAWADFPEENVPEVEEFHLFSVLTSIEESLSHLLSDFDRGRVFREGVETAIVGRPNAGKSTLMNLLSGCERSIVTQYAGTTRDVIEETVLLGGVPLCLADTAGIRKTEDPVEKIGVEAAKKRLSTAQLIFAVFDSSESLTSEDRELIEALPPSRTLAIVNKTDLQRRLDEEELSQRFPHLVHLSASKGEGMEALEQEVSQLLGTEDFDPMAPILSTERQKNDAQAARLALQEGISALKMGMTLDAVTVCVEDSLRHLYALTGENVSEEIIDKVFSTFCVGK